MFLNPRYHIYLLQLENFYLSRFWRAAWRDGFRAPKSLRHPIVWTAKMSAVVFLATLISLALAVTAGWGAALLFSELVVGWVVAVFLLLALIAGFFVPLAAAVVLLLPADRLLRRLLIVRAQRKVSALTELTIIGITGSYGKTTMKQTLVTLLSKNLNVVASAESHNTPVAIARTVLRMVDETTDVLIVEMGAYERGDIAELCRITPPNISVLTGINEAHLERFGSLENTIDAKFEIVTAAPADASVILNADDDTVLTHFSDYVADGQVMFYSARNHERSLYHAYDQRFHEDGSGISFRLKRGEERLGYVKVSHLANYIIGNIIAGVTVGKQLGISEAEVLQQAHQITPPEHRLQPIQRTSQNVLVIDDSYNGNPDGAHAAIDVLEKFISRRTIYVTPGLVEMGEESEAVHKKIGQHLAAVVDVVVLVETSATDWIKDGLKSAGFAGELHTFASPQEMHEQISMIVGVGDVLLFQNDWPENYR